ncbi:MAG TPA: NADH-quinone oxidoreductase subunit N [Gaiellaceae bacterium]|nr:NADH-quinone oxidoreductase subunit N [Gaiellaceae bacterium]
MKLHTTHVDWFGLATVFALIGGSFLALLCAVLVPQALRRAASLGITVTGFTAGLVLSVWLYVDSANGHTIVHGAFYRDRWTALGQIILCGIGLATSVVSADHIPVWGRNADQSHRDDHIAEFFALLLASAAGMAFFVGAANLMVLFLSLEWFSIALYVMCAIDYPPAASAGGEAAGARPEDRGAFGVPGESSLEAGLKYLIVGSFGAGALLFGSALVYGATGQISFHGIAHAVASRGLTGDTFMVVGIALIVAGLAFKMSAAPFHMWTPDVYEGAPTAVTAWMASATKVAALLLAFRLMTTAFPHNGHLWGWAFAIIAAFSLAIGNFAALVQRNVKRILAYSSISHAGFMLIALSAGSALGGRALMYYLVPYSAMAFGSFAIVAARERELGVPVTLENLAGFGWERPFLGVAMWFFMFGFAGLPLGGGFVGKFYVFAAAYRHGWVWLVIVGVLATLVSLYYYLGIVRAMYMRPAEELQVQPGGGVAVGGGAPAAEWLLHLAVGAALAVSVGSLFAVQPLIDLARHAASALPL